MNLINKLFARNKPEPEKFPEYPTQVKWIFKGGGTMDGSVYLYPKQIDQRLITHKSLIIEAPSGQVTRIGCDAVAAFIATPA